MSKRTAPAVDGEAPPEKRLPKRQKLDAPRGPPPKAEEIHSARQLQQLLVFQQDNTQSLRNGIHSLKVFLESILYPSDEYTVPRQKGILRDFLDTQKPRNGDQDGAFLSNIMQTWSFASQSNNDHLSSAAVAVLALLLKTISHNLEMREHGLQLCRTVLQIPHLKLLARGLSAPKHKEFVISPCLRLLTELVSFDGGAVAKQVYSKRDFTFEGKILSRNLGIRRNDEETTKEKRKPAVRTNAVKYVLAHFRNQEEGAKIDILKHGNVMRALFDHIRDDPPDIATEILDVVRSHIIADKEIPRASKSHVFTDRTLYNIASLYRVEQPLDEESDEKAIDVVAHRFLLHVCRSPEAGVLIPSSGWYPPGTDKEPEREDADTGEASIDLGLDSLEWYDRYRGRVTIRNSTLATFMQGLRPYANKLEQELVLAIFEACPELVADYFFKKTNFAFDPKLTSTWIGYASFLFSAIQLPVPQSFGHREGYAYAPPPVSVAIESLLPQPLTQKVLTRCLNQSSDLITFFAVRLLTIAFQKLEQVLQSFKTASSNHPHQLWDQAAERLTSEFCERCPKMKDVISTFRRIPNTNMMQREAVTRLLSLYYRVTPHVALDEKFDVAMALTTALKELMKQEESGEEHEIKLLELGHLLQIARNAPDMRWWQKPESLQFSPFTSILKVLAASPDGASSHSIAQLLLSVIREHGFLQTDSQPSALDALVASLQSSDELVPDAVFAFLDECFGRFVRKPIKYQDDVDAFVAAAQVEDISKSPVSLLLATLVEQWPFVLKLENNAAHDVAQWIAKFISSLRQIGENESVLQLMLNTMLDGSDGANCRKPLAKGLKSTQTLEIKPLTGEFGVDATDKSGVEGQADSEGGLDISLELPPKEDGNHPELTRWMHKDVDDVIDEGHLGALLLCLCSEHLSIRRQALPNVQKLMAKVQESSHEERELIYLLMGEIYETARPLIAADESLPWVAGTLAARAVPILADPASFLYPKMGSFLTRGPSWTVSRLPSYWAEKIILNPPEGDDAAYWQEVEWLLEWYLEGLRTEKDLGIFRARGIFERVLALYNNPASSKRTKQLVLRFLFRTAAVEGGSTTLITRAGVLSWIKMQLANATGNKRVKRERSGVNGIQEETLLKKLAGRLWETCDKGRVEEWSGGGAAQEMELLMR
ncbi:ribosome 60S biogenesis N-terminal-domain-containing protein [Macrophomina phaseolina]|uniref:Ribosome 60S biogenesis N-terminal-domain-containing protein n=1 Tax=Macrophomina phaseolina TaxID=35725 RepID=A0ABQ8GAH2_9PEZI|nr:ribosome 60S biogenesis N-terminal-domain-containing protein [Macrophomina phaseolina]